MAHWCKAFHFIINKHHIVWEFCFIIRTLIQIIWPVPLHTPVIVSSNISISPICTSSRTLMADKKCSLDFWQAGSFRRESAFSFIWITFIWYYGCVFICITSAAAESIFWYLPSMISLTNLILSAHIVILNVDSFFLKTIEANSFAQTQRYGVKITTNKIIHEVRIIISDT